METAINLYPAILESTGIQLFCITVCLLYSQQQHLLWEWHKEIAIRPLFLCLHQHIYKYALWDSGN